MMVRHILFLFLIAGTVALFSGCTKTSDNSPAVQNQAPSIAGISQSRPRINTGDTLRVTCSANDRDSDPIAYQWSALTGRFVTGGTDSVAYWTTVGAIVLDSVRVVLHVEVSDGTDSTSDSLHVVVYRGDQWNDTGEPFIDMPDTNGHYNGVWDYGEMWFDLPSTYIGPGYIRAPFATTNGVYDPPNGVFDEYELFTRPPLPEDSLDLRYPVAYTWEDVRHGIHHGGHDWLDLGLDSLGRPQYFHWIVDKSTWRDRDQDGVFDPPVAH